MKEFCDPAVKPVFCKWIEDQWQICVDSPVADVDIQGSPERVLSRAVIKDTSGRRFLIEKFGLAKRDHRTFVADCVHALHEKGLTQAVEYKKASSGAYLPIFQKAAYQVSDYLDSTGLKQPEYLQSSQMGKSFGLFLTDMSTAARKADTLPSRPVFSIKAYIHDLFARMKIHDQAAYHRFLPILAFLEKSFMRIHDSLLPGFCHGDLHPMNALWNKDEIRAVIDWEFTGVKPEIYDAANLVGCAGFEHPEGLGGPMVMSFLAVVRQNRLYSPISWQHFPEFLLALRFAWLSEWLRKNDTEMVEMEEAYMQLLIDNMQILRKGWNL